MIPPTGKPTGRWPSAAGQSFDVKQEMIGGAKAFVLTTSEFSARKNGEKSIYLESGGNIYITSFSYSSIEEIGGLPGECLGDDDLALLYQTAQKIIKTFIFIP